MKKILLTLLVLVVLAGAVILYFVAFHLDSMIEDRIETAATQTLGTRVSVGTVRTNVRDGSLTISQIDVANPPGFRNPNAFSLNQVQAAVDYSTGEVRRVVIDNPSIVIEEVGGQTNFDRMLEELRNLPDEAPDAGSGRDEPVIVVRHFRMNQSSAAFESQSFDRNSSVEIDAVELNDLKGTPREIAKVIASEIAAEVTREAGTELLKAQARRQFDDLEQRASEKLKDLFGNGDDSAD